MSLTTTATQLQLQFAFWMGPHVHSAARITRAQVGAPGGCSNATCQSAIKPRCPLLKNLFTPGLSQEGQSFELKTRTYKCSKASV